VSTGLFCFYFFVRETTLTISFFFFFFERALTGVVAGICGALVGCPADVALVRATTTSLVLSPTGRPPNVIQIIGSIVKKDGAQALWTGWLPTCARAALLNMSQLATYTQAKQFILEKRLLNKEGQDGLGAHISASMVSAFAATTCSIPADIVKTRMQSGATAAGRGPIGVALNMIRTEGVLSLWKGFVPCQYKKAKFRGVAG
jgi:solute carrier family 25 oxoglutarate transporter 11